MAEGDGDSGKGRRLTVAAEAIRNSAIMAQLHAGEKVADVARAHMITTRQVRRVAKSFEIRRTAIEDRPMAIVERTLREFEERMRNFALLAAENVESMPAVALGALKAAAEQHDRYIELLSDVGKLPDNLELFKSQSEVEKLGVRLLRLVREVAEGRITAADLGEEVWSTLEMLRGEPVVDVDPSAVRELPEVTGDGDLDREG